MTITGVLFYYCLFVFVIYFLIRKKTNSLSLAETAIAFGVKILAGCAYGYIFLKFYGGDDTWAFHRLSLTEYEKLVHHPLVFLQDLSPASAFRAAHSFPEGIHFYIMDLEYWVMGKLLAIFNIFSRGHYYINVVFFNFLVFWGQYWLFKLLNTYFPGKRTILYIVIFLFPPAVFWLSGIRADGLLLLFLALLLVQFSRWLYARKTSSLILCFPALLGIIIFRDALLLLLIPAFISWFLTVRLQWKPWRTYLVVYTISGCIFFLSPAFLPGNGLPGIIAHRQQEFFALHGNTRFALDTLKPAISSYAYLLPQAANNTLLRPYVWEAKGALQWMAAAEVIIVFVILILTVSKPDPKWKNYIVHPILISFIFISVTLYLVIGYTVPFPGAIVRYKVIGELLLLLVLTLLINWPKKYIK